ncbi:MAG: hypothetical protein ACYTKD_08240 [Planctomycetota bacterium]|jgi:hypothetical protein
METIGRIMSSELFVTAALVAVPWLIARAFAWWRAEARRRSGERYLKAIEALETGVQEAWERFGRAWKAARIEAKPAGAGGETSKRRFSDDERERLRTVAREVAVEAGREKGVDVVAELGRRAIGGLIRRIVERRKRGR